VEHVAAAADDLGRFLAAAPGVRMLATSRAALGLSAEHTYPLAPLDAEQAASELFVERARAAQASFALDADGERVVVELCRRLDGLPLAIELAAARTRLLTPQALLGRLDARLESLGSGPRDAPARQRSLRATAAWSYDLLTADEQQLFDELSVFAGPFS